MLRTAAKNFSIRWPLNLIFIVANYRSAIIALAMRESKREKAEGRRRSKNLACFHCLLPSAFCLLLTGFRLLLADFRSCAASLLDLLTRALRKTVCRDTQRL